MQIEELADKFIKDNDCNPCFKGLHGYKYATCISVNEQIVHGMPRTDKVLNEGDIVSVDVGAGYNGMNTDACRTFGVGKISDEAQRLIDETRNSFFEAVKVVKAGALFGAISEAVEGYIKKNTPYSILENYFGHGIGKEVHLDPLIPNYKPNHPRLLTDARKKMVENTAICIEPMILAGKKDVKTAKDGWTVVSVDGKLTAHYENTVLITKNGAEILTNKFYD
jgi:methionyl aminopeptidase